MGGSHFSPAFAKAATVALAWLPALAVISALLNGSVTVNLTFTVLLLCALATLGIVVMYPAVEDPPARRSAIPAVPDAGARAWAAESRAATMRSILDAAEEPVLATDSAGAVVLANRAAALFFGRADGEMTGLVIEDLFSQAEILGLHGGALGGARRGAQVRIPRPGGVRVFQVLAAPLALATLENAGTHGAPARPGVVLMLRDVTELSAAVQLKTDFVANASHELRTPLASIRAAAETLAEHSQDRAMLRRLTAMIASNVTRLEDLTRDLLDLSRLESPEAPVEKGPVRSSEVAEALAEIFEPALAERHIGLHFDFTAEAEHLQTDSRLLTLILKNLIENSTKFAYEGSTIRVVGEALAASPGRSQRPALRLRVIDEGLGIPLSHQARIFERFYQGDPSRSGDSHRRGTGLGLAIVKHSVKNLGGTVSVSSVWKEGTTITVEIPDCVADG